MIGRLRGKLIHKQAPFVLIDVGGVGYEVEATSGALFRLPAAGEECVIYIHMTVREDAHLLYGFADLAERTLFRELIKVNGVGGRMALAIVSSMTVNEFARSVIEGDARALTRVPGVGKKSAERLIVELRDRMSEQWAPPGSSAASLPRSDVQIEADPMQEAAIALGALGYKPHEASRMLRAIDARGKSSEELIRGALQQAVKA
ncbi:MAG: Holliday junction branch migration protein RuvA [Chromatiales bacterium]|jgi:Holliday junction DNA helicase RuvA|nr:Holliday junction branch migration protein RuvA [Chromatiales bacterium]